MDAPGGEVYAYFTVAPSASACNGSEMRVLPPQRRQRMKEWLVPPVLFPVFLVLLIIGYAILRAPTGRPHAAGKDSP